MHGLLHLIDYVEHLGPAWCSWAFPMERICGLIQPLARSKVYLDESISNAFSYQIYPDMIPFARCTDHDIDGDSINSDENSMYDFSAAEGIEDESSEDNSADTSDLSDSDSGASDYAMPSESITDEYRARAGLRGYNTKAQMTCHAGLLFHSRFEEELEERWMRLLRKFYRNLYDTLPRNDPLFFTVSDEGISWAKFKLRRRNDSIKSEYSGQ